MQRIDITHDFRLPVSRVYAYLAEHEHLAPLFGATIRRVQDGATSRNGVGSARTLKIGPLPSFVETTTVSEPNSRIEYKITQGSPLKGHEGVMRFTSLPDGGSHLDYTITFDGKVPGLGAVVAFGLKRNITKGLKQVDAKA